MAFGNISLENLEDLMSLFRKNNFEADMRDGKVTISIKAENIEKAEEEIDRVIGIINRSGSYNFLIEKGEIKKNINGEFECFLYFKDRIL